MTHDSAAENALAAGEIADQQKAREQQRVGRSIWDDDLKRAAKEAEKAKGLRRQIEATKQNGRDDNGERLRELGAEHHRLTGAGGKAI